MARYIVSYDLVTPGKDYATLWAELKSMNAERVLQSQWVFERINTNAVGLRNHFKQFIDSNDRLLITCLDSDDWASFNTMIKLSDV